MGRYDVCWSIRYILICFVNQRFDKTKISFLDCIYQSYGRFRFFDMTSYKDIVKEIMSALLQICNNSLVLSEQCNECSGKKVNLYFSLSR